MIDRYIENGFKNRRDYLKSLAEEYDIDYNIVSSVASLLGPDEDFDGLISTLNDISEYGEVEWE